MYNVIKVLNNSVLLATCESSNREVILLGKGIGFQYKANNEIKDLSDMRIYELQDMTSKGSSMQIIDKVDPSYLEIAHEIIALAERKFNTIDANILLPLADHIAFAIERIKQKMDIVNPFANDIRLLFPDEYEIALAGKKRIEEITGMEISEDEVGYITLHVHAALGHDQVDKSMLVAVIINDSIKSIEEDCNIKIDVRSISYSRLLMHIKYMLARLEQKEKLNLDMEDYTKTNFPYSYDVAKRICVRIGQTIHQSVPRIEIGYLALHIERVCRIDEPKD